MKSTDTLYPAAQRSDGKAAVERLKLPNPFNSPQQSKLENKSSFPIYECHRSHEWKNLIGEIWQWRSPKTSAKDHLCQFVSVVPPTSWTPSLPVRFRRSSAQQNSQVAVWGDHRHLYAHAFNGNSRVFACGGSKRRVHLNNNNERRKARKFLRHNSDNTQLNATVLTNESVLICFLEQCLLLSFTGYWRVELLPDCQRFVVSVVWAT